VNILDIRIKQKTFGIYILTLSTLLLIITISSSVLLLSFGLGSNLNILALLPFIVLMLLILFFCAIGIYIGIRYIKQKPFKKNRALGTTLIILGLTYLGYSLIVYIFSNLTGNTGGELKPLFAFLWTLVIVPFGLTLRNS
jgi:amino acid transporter